MALVLTIFPSLIRICRPPVASTTTGSPLATLSSTSDPGSATWRRDTSDAPSSSPAKPTASPLANATTHSRPWPSSTPRVTRLFKSTASPTGEKASSSRQLDDPRRQLDEPVAVLARYEVDRVADLPGVVGVRGDFDSIVIEHPDLAGGPIDDQHLIATLDDLDVRSIGLRLRLGLTGATVDLDDPLALRVPQPRATVGQIEVAEGEAGTSDDGNERDDNDAGYPQSYEPRRLPIASQATQPGKEVAHDLRHHMSAFSRRKREATATFTTVLTTRRRGHGGGRPSPARGPS